MSQEQWFYVAMLVVMGIVCIAALITQYKGFRAHGESMAGALDSVISSKTTEAGLDRLYNRMPDTVKPVIMTGLEALQQLTQGIDDMIPDEMDDVQLAYVNKLAKSINKLASQVDGVIPVGDPPEPVQVAAAPGQKVQVVPQVNTDMPQDME